jgi:hypothetical protein
MWVPAVVVQDRVCQIADAFGDDVPFKWAGGSSKGEPQYYDCQFFIWQLGDCLNGRCCVEVAPLVHQLDINFLDHNWLV